MLCILLNKFYLCWWIEITILFLKNSRTKFVFGSKEDFFDLIFPDKFCLETMNLNIAKWNRDESGWSNMRMINDSIYVGHRIAMEMLVYLIHHRDRDTDCPHPFQSGCRSAQISLVKSAFRTYD